jgi:hypothetical protein
MSEHLEQSDQEQKDISIEFPAPWSSTLKNFLMVGAGVVVVANWTFTAEDITGIVGLICLAVPLLIVFIAVFCVVGRYEITKDKLIVHRFGWKTEFDLADLKSAKYDQKAMEGATRSLTGEGNWLVVAAENFKSERLGDFKAYVTEPALSVALRFKHGNVVVSPEDPDQFVQTIRNLAGLEAAPID